MLYHSDIWCTKRILLIGLRKKMLVTEQRIIRKIHNIPLAINSSPVPSISIDQERDHTPLSVSSEDADLPFEVFREMWKKAEKLVADNDAITAAPKLPNCKMVTSYSNPLKPHLVSW